MASKKSSGGGASKVITKDVKVKGGKAYGQVTGNRNMGGKKGC